jgi:hypothetical protein
MAILKKGTPYLGWGSFGITNLPGNLRKLTRRLLAVFYFASVYLGQNLK